MTTGRSIWQLSGNDSAHLAAIERRAQSLGDPIESLRYLRQATHAAATPGRIRWTVPIVLSVALTGLRSDAVPAIPSLTVTPSAAIQRAAQAFKTPNVWPVEQTRDYDLYSNGLRIENAMAVSNEPRLYRLIAHSGAAGPMRTQPAGIVFHTTESDQTAFEPEQNHTIASLGHDLLLYVRRMHAYHFVIDRFGRVHRIVVESDTANHAGPSVWADSKWTYVDLNSSFLSVAFEAAMQPSQSIITEGQLRAAKALTEMLRAKYNLAAENCVVHAQISVNPDNWHIGLHADWGFAFPFQELGLPDNYRIPSPAIYLFGFEYDPVYTSVTGPDIWNGLAQSEQRVAAAAAENRMSPAQYRGVLHQRFRDAQTAVHTNAGQESQHE